MRRPRQKRDPLTNFPECNSPATAELDFLDKIRAVREVLTGTLEGQIDDPGAIAVCSKILDHATHRLQVCRINARRAA